MYAAAIIYLAMYEWRRLFLQDTSKFFSNYTYGYSRFAIFSYNLWKILKEAISIRLGRDGERAVGQFL